MTTDPQVLVVGAGPTGLLLAAELNRRGLGCRLVDAHPAPLHWDRATVVHPRSLEVFDSLGILEPLLAAGVKQRMARLHSGGTVLGQIDLSTCGSRHGFNLGLSEEVTESILTDYLHRNGGDVVSSSRLVSLELHEDGVIARIEGGAGSSEQFMVQWVVGCDGLHSVTRQQSAIGLDGHDMSEPWAVFDATASGWSDPFEANFAYLDVVPVILTALPDRRWRVYLRPSAPDSDLVAEAGSTVRRYHPGVVFDGVSNPTRFDCHTRIARQYRSGRVLLAGDAAHVCSPFQGHGMNSGLQDAYNLAWKLALVCLGRCSPELLDSYEAERRPVAERITSLGDPTEHALALTDRAARAERDESLRRVFANPALRHQEAIAEAELDIDYGDSPIVMGDSNAALQPGHRLPNTISVRLPGGEEAFLDQLANGMAHTALLIGGPAAEAGDLRRLGAATRAATDASLIGATVVATASADGHDTWTRLDPSGADRLGVDGTSLLAVRPDGYIGLHADHHHLKALADYQAMLGSGLA